MVYFTLNFKSLPGFNLGEGVSPNRSPNLWKELLKKTTFTRFRIWLAVLIGIVLISYLASKGISIWTDYELTEDSAKRTAQSLVNALEEHAARTFGEADQVLLNVIDAIHNKGGIDKFNERTLHELFLSKKQQAPQIGEIILVNSQGMLLANSSKYPVGDLNLSDREYFIHFRDKPTSDLFISRPFQTSISKLWRVILAREMRDFRGKFQGVIAIGIIPDYFNKFYRSINVEEGGFVDLVRRDGYSLIHEPFSEIYTTINFSKHPLFTEHLPKAPFGTYFSQSPVTFKTYLRSYRTVTGFPLIAVISLSKDNIFQRWYSRAWNQGVSAIMVLAIVFIVSILLFMQLKKLEIAEEALSNERQRLYDVLEMLPAYIILLTPDYHVSFANRYFVENFGESGGKRCFEYLFGRTEPCETCETYTVLKTNEPRRWERTGPDGRTYDIYNFPFTDVDGSLLIMEMGIDITERKRLISELQEALAQVKTLKGLLPICAHCKKIRDDEGYWQQAEKYIRDRSEAEFSHGICPECAKKYFPSFIGNEAPLENKKITGVVRGQGRILFMDDAENVRDVMSRMLEKLGYEVVCAKDGAEAIDLYKKAQEANQTFTAAIFDLNITGGMGGKEALEQLLAADPKIKVIASSVSNDLTGLARHGFIAAIAKPYSISELSKVLHQVVMKNSLHPEAKGGPPDRT